MTPGPRLPLVVVVPLAILLPLSAAACRGDGGDGDESFKLQVAADGDRADYRYVIPAGAGRSAIDGAPIEVLPAEMDVHVGEVIEIENNDDRGHLVGPFFVGAGETMRQTFASPGVFDGVCSVHPSGQIVIKVT